jgi:hypothetical protein
VNIRRQETSEKWTFEKLVFKCELWPEKKWIKKSGFQITVLYRSEWKCSKIGVCLFQMVETRWLPKPFKVGIKLSSIQATT